MVSLHEGLTELSRDFRMLRREVTLFGRIGIQIVQCSVIGFGFVDELKGPPARGAVDGENARGHDGLVGDPAAGVKVAKIATLEKDIAMALKAEGVRILAEMDELWPPGDTNATRRAKLLQCVEALAFDAPRSAMGRGVLLSLCHRWLVVVGKWHNAEARVALSALAERHAAGFPRALHRLGTTDVALSSTVLSALLNICAAVPVPSNLEDALVPLFAVELDAGRVAYGPFARWPAQLQETACAVAQRAVAGDDGAGELAKAVNLAALRIGTRS